MKIFLNFKYLFFIACLFIFIYSPPIAFIPLGTIKLLSILSITGLLFYFKQTTLQILRYKYVTYALIFLVLAIFYAFIQDYIIYESPSLGESNFYRQILVLVEVLPIALFTSLYARKYLKFSLEDILQSCIVIAAIQSFFCLIMFVVPGIKSYVVNSLLEDQSAKEKILETGFYGNLRGFGISIGYLFSFPVFQGLAICLILLICLRNFSKNYYTLLTLPFLFLSIILNARIGFISIVLFLLVTFCVYLKNLKISAISQFTLISLAILLSIYTFSTTIYESSSLEKNIDWIVKSYTQNRAFIEGKGEEGTLSILLEGHFHFPKTLNGNLFGEGKYIFGDNEKKSTISSDIGYIRTIYFGGYVYSFFLYSSFCMLLWGALRLQKNIVFRILMYFLFILIFVVNIKGDIFWSNPCYRAAYLITLFPVADRYVSRREQKKLQKQLLYKYQEMNLAAPFIKN